MAETEGPVAVTPMEVWNFSTPALVHQVNWSEVGLSSVLVT